MYKILPIRNTNPIHTTTSIFLRGLIMFCLLWGGLVSSQQVPVFSAYYFNKFLVNPAFTGIDNEYRAFGFYRTQWANIPARPVTGGATAEGSFWKDQIGLGIQGINDQAGVFNQTTLSLSYAQKIHLAKYHQLSVGLMGEALMNRIDFGDITTHTAGDPAIGDEKISRTTFDFGAGISYSFKDLLVGFSVPNILQPNAKYAVSSVAQSNYEYLRQYDAFAQYKIRLLKGKFNITPTLLLRKAEASQFQLDATAIFDYKNLVFAGGGYRTAFGVIAMAGVNIVNTVTIAYAYDYTTQPLIAGQVGATHELTVGVHIPSDFKAHKKVRTNGPAAGAEDIVSTKQATIDSLGRNTDSLGAALTSTQKALDSVNKISAQHAKELAEQKAMNDAHAKDLANGNTALKSQPLAKDLSTNTDVDWNVAKAEGQRFKLDKILFEYKQYRLLPQSEEQLNSLVDLLNQHPKIRILLKGYTDNIGPDDYNDELSNNRAKAVANYLIEHGINKARIDYFGLGNQNPVGDNNTETGREQNRRVEFVIER